MDSPSLIIGTTTLITGIGLIYWINRRKFYRRSMTGLEGFSSFETSIFIRFLERIGKWIAYALIIVGILCFWASASDKKNISKKNATISILK